MPKLLISDTKGKIASHPYLGAVGMASGDLSLLEPSGLVRLPPASRLFMLPDRAPIGYDGPSGDFVTVYGGFFAVAAFISPGFTVTYSPAYREKGRPAKLPLFSYAAVAFYRGDLYTAALRIDKDTRHDCRFIKVRLVQKNARRFRKAFKGNRLIPHLEMCALTYGCPNAQNFFLNRYEAPLPTSPSCNAACAGCISYQPGKSCASSQPRIKFVPTPEEVSEVALFHIKNVRKGIVSFGQGCEGEPLLQAGRIERSIRLIRQKTDRGTIHMNTNGSRPDALRRLFDAGLDSVRISLNSARKEFYARYYKPRGYDFHDVLKSIDVARKKKAFVSINYLTMPGFTDSRDEFKSFEKLVGEHKVDMIQWRNLNYDPVRYFEELRIGPGSAEVLGIREIIGSLKKEFPDLRMGYFNPSMNQS